jgi:hypothetical protein
MPKSIIGESFKPYVADQIKIRQQKLNNNSSRDSDLLKYINNKTSWIRLSSGVNVSPLKLIELGLSTAFNGNKLAINNTLFSSYQYVNPGTNIDDWKGNFTAGIGYSTSGNSALTSYGFNSTPDYGFVPPPGIKSIDIKSLNRGSLREATVEIECHSLSQFNVIEALYLKLRYSMLLEWGHTLWYDNTGNIQSNMPDWVHKGFLNGDYDQDKILETLEKQRQEFCSNYDGFLGYVKNFEWSLRQDGGYDITLNLISIGDIIESLKVNTNYPSSNAIISTEITSETPNIVVNKNKSTLHQILYAIMKTLDAQDGYLDGFNNSGRQSLQSSEIVKITKEQSQYDLINPNYIDSKEETDWNKASDILTYQEGYRIFFKSLITDEDGDATGGNFYYIKLGTLLRIVEAFLIKYDTSKGGQGKYKPLFYIDHNYDNNLCFTLPKQISANPKICFLNPSEIAAIAPSSPNTNTVQIKYIKYIVKVIQPPGFFDSDYLTIEESIINQEDISGDFEDKLIDQVKKVQSDSDAGTNKFEKFEYKRDGRLERIQAFGINQSLEYVFYERLQDTVLEEVDAEIREDSSITSINNLFRVQNYPFVGKLMHIHVSIDFISQTLENNIDEDGKVSLYDFLSKIMSGIQEALGNINSFEVTYDEITNYFTIRDNSTIPGANNYLKELYSDLAASGSFDLTPTKINVNLLTSTEGSFATSVSIKSKLDNKFASTISIGAQANGNQVGENATALSKLNIGFIDRILKEKSDIISKSSEDGGEEDEEKKSKSPEEIYAQNIISYLNFLKLIREKKVTENDISTYTQALVDLYNYEIGYLTQQRFIGGVGFIPIDLNITMDGLSGPRIYESYTINDNLLPINYKNNIQFITVGVSHKVDSNGWITTLDSISGPKQDNLKEYQINYNTTGLTTANIGASTNSSNIPSPRGSGLCKSINNIPNVNYIRNNRIGGDLNSNPEVRSRKTQGIKNGDTRGLVQIAATGNNALSIGNESALLTPRAKAALDNWMNDITNQGGCITISSVFRTKTQQDAVKAQKIKEGRGNSAATPGSSPHGWGVAIDIRELYRLVNGDASPSANAKARESKVYKFIAAAGEKYGWYNPWRLADGSNTDECWHFEYWG